MGLALSACIACGDTTPNLVTDGISPSTTTTGEPTTIETTLQNEEEDGSGTPTTSGSDTSGATESTAADDAPPPVCGDAHLDPSEQCDNGEALNDDHEYCTDACKYNICGDGLLFAGHEDCDHGAANSDDYGSYCTEQCTPGAWCGDNIVQPGLEQCDNGPGNDTPELDEQGISCDKMCRMKARRIFITSHSYNGKLGGLSGADEKCRQAALDAGLPDSQRFMAMLSDAGMSMKTRYEDKLGEPMPYVLVSGKKIADSYTGLIAHGPVPQGVHLTEMNESVVDRYVASNTAKDGSIYQEFDDQDKLIVTDCDGWSSDSKSALGRLGLNSMDTEDPDYATWVQDKQWLSESTLSCNTSMHIYCIEL